MHFLLRVPFRYMSRLCNLSNTSAGNNIISVQVFAMSAQCSQQNILMMQSDLSTGSCTQQHLRQVLLVSALCMGLLSSLQGLTAEAHRLQLQKLGVT